MDAFVVHHQAIALEQDVQPPIAESGALGRMCLQALEDGLVRRAGSSLIPPSGRAQSHGGHVHHFGLDDSVPAAGAAMKTRNVFAFDFE